MPRILLVEDNELNRDMLSRRLVRRGFEVVIATDGEQGIVQATSDKPDLILMDLSLPVIDGWSATRQIKANPDTGRIPVIALTAHAMSGDREKAIDAGVRRLRLQAGRNRPTGRQNQRASGPVEHVLNVGCRAEPADPRNGAGLRDL